MNAFSKTNNCSRDNDAGFTAAGSDPVNNVSVTEKLIRAGKSLKKNCGSVPRISFPSSHKNRNMLLLAMLLKKLRLGSAKLLKPKNNDSNEARAVTARGIVEPSKPLFWMSRNSILWGIAALETWPVYKVSAAAIVLNAGS